MNTQHYRLMLSAAFLWLTLSIFITCTTPTASETSLNITQSELNFGISLRSLHLTLKNQGDEPLDWKISDVPDCISVTNLTGSISAHDHQELSVDLDRFRLENGKHENALTIAAGEEQMVIPVHYLVNGPRLYVYKSELDFGCETETQSVLLENIGNQSVRYSAETDVDWLALTPASGRIGREPLTVNIEVLRDTSNHEFNIPYTSTIKFVPDNPDFHTEKLEIRMEVPNPYT